MDGVQRQFGAEMNWQNWQKMLFGLVFACIGALMYGWRDNNQRIIATQQAQIDKFISAGPRFTAKDGQELCERVRTLEFASIGFMKSGKPHLDCTYDKRQ